MNELTDGTTTGVSSSGGEIAFNDPTRGAPVEQRGVSIQRLFEDPEFESELLNLIARRMDPSREWIPSLNARIETNDPPSYDG